MALPNLSGSLIQDTYQRVMHTDGNTIYDGAGNTVLSSAALASLQVMGSANITNTEWLEIAHIGNAAISAAEWTSLSSMGSNADNISATQWGYVANMQNVAFNTSPAFYSVCATALPENPPSFQIGATPAFANKSQRMGIGFAEPYHTASILFIQDRTTVALIDPVGNISSSGNLTANFITARTQYRFSNDTVRISELAGGGLHIDGSGPVKIAGPIYGSSTISATHITSSGNISASGKIAGSELYTTGELHLQGKRIDYDDTNLWIKDTGLNIWGNVTASGNISASGEIQFNNIKGGTF